MPRRKHIKLRPLRTGELLDEAIELYKANFALFIGIAAILYIPNMVMDPMVTVTRSYLGYADWRGYIGMFASVIWFLLIAGPIITGALTYAVSERYLEHSTTIKECFSHILTFRNMLNLLLTNAVLVTVTFLAALIPVFILGFALTMIEMGKVAGGIALIALAVFSMVIPCMVFGKLALAIPAVILEKYGVFASLQRSCKLTRNRVAHVSGILLLITVIVTTVQSIMTSPSSFAITQSVMRGITPNPVIIMINALLVSITSAALLPVTSVITLLLYYDSRIRDEAFDLEVLASEMEYF